MRPGIAQGLCRTWRAVGVRSRSAIHAKQLPPATEDIAERHSRRGRLRLRLLNRKLRVLAGIWDDNSRLHTGFLSSPSAGQISHSCEGDLAGGGGAEGETLGQAGLAHGFHQAEMMEHPGVVGDHAEQEIFPL